MRSFILVCFVALLVAVGLAFAVGLLEVTTDHPDGKEVVTLTINTSMVHPLSSAIHSASEVPSDKKSEDAADIKGRITAVRPEKKELTVSENVQNWIFKMAPESKVFINDQEGKLADLRVGDDAVVSFNRQGPDMIASVVHATRNK
jgi:hypothetical protein